MAPLAFPPQPKAPTLIISGNFQGKLTPCGCTRPMSGGIRRLSSLVANSSGAVWVDTGGWVTGSGAQDVMKAEAVADTFGQLGVTAVLRTPAETTLGESTVANLAEAVGKPWVNESAVETSDFWIGGSVSGDEPVQLGRWLKEAPAGKKTVWMTNRPLPEALELSGPDVVVYRSEGSPELAPRQAGRTWWVSPGSKAKMAVVISMGAKPAYKRVELTEEFPDEPRANRVFEAYLDRVSQAKLIERLPRHSTEAFSGNEKCGSCHPSQAASWTKSRHARALATLEKLREDRDPDCLPCHVVGLESTRGFRDRKTTPELANVGCEACHGPSENHAADPYHIHLNPVKLTGCVSCHNADNSPGFNPQEAWKTISHGHVDKFSLKAN